MALSGTEGWAPGVLHAARCQWFLAGMQGLRSSCTEARGSRGFCPVRGLARLGRVLINRQPSADLDVPPNVRYWG